MISVEMLSARQSKVRIPWGLRGKIELGSLQWIGRNSLGLPYLQGQIRNCSTRPLHLRITARVLKEHRKPIFSGSPGILDTFSIDAQQQRTFRISLRDVEKLSALSRQELWEARSGVDLHISQ